MFKGKQINNPECSYYRKLQMDINSARIYPHIFSKGSTPCNIYSTIHTD
jgi:hypothetical protein